MILHRRAGRGRAAKQHPPVRLNTSPVMGRRTDQQRTSSATPIPKCSQRGFRVHRRPKLFSHLSARSSRSQIAHGIPRIAGRKRASRALKGKTVGDSALTVSVQRNSNPAGKSMLRIDGTTETLRQITHLARPCTERAGKVLEGNCTRIVGVPHPRPRDASRPTKVVAPWHHTLRVR